MDNSLKNNPISAFIATVVIVIFSLYTTNAIKTIPCDKNMVDNFKSTFVHVDRLHLMSNLYALYALSRVERELGTKKFLILIIFLVCINTIIETSLHKITNKIPCSIGFSGILFGIMAYEIITQRGIDPYILSSILIMVITPSLKSSKVSFSGHLIGTVSGVISALIYSKFI